MEKMEKSGDESCLKRRMIAEDNDYKRYCCQFRKSGGFVVQSCSDIVMDNQSLSLSSSIIPEMTEALKKKKKKKKRRRRKKKEIKAKVDFSIKLGKFAVDDYNKRKIEGRVRLEFVKALDVFISGTPGVYVRTHVYFHAKEVGDSDDQSSTYEAIVSKDFQMSPKVFHFMVLPFGFPELRGAPRISREEEIAFYKMFDDDDLGWDVDHPIGFGPEDRRIHLSTGYFIRNGDILPRRRRMPWQIE